jgi:predicted site-specific integrase-resolvase
MEELITRDELSSILCVHISTLYNWEKRKMLCPVRIGKKVYYKNEDVKRFLKF